jgi:hypothetical protein
MSLIIITNPFKMLNCPVPYTVMLTLFEGNYKSFFQYSRAFRVGLYGLFELVYVVVTGREALLYLRQPLQNSVRRVPQRVVPAAQVFNVGLIDTARLVGALGDLVEVRSCSTIT